MKTPTETKRRSTQRHGQHLCTFHNLMVANGLLFLLICILKVYLMISHPVLHGNEIAEDRHLYKASLMGAGDFNHRVPLQQHSSSMGVQFSHDAQGETDINLIPVRRDIHDVSMHRKDDLGTGVITNNVSVHKEDELGNGVVTASISNVAISGAQVPTKHNINEILGGQESKQIVAFDINETTKYSNR